MKAARWAAAAAMLLVAGMWLGGCGDEEGENDTVAPAAITDLRVIDSSGSSVTLAWTSPGDDSSAGKASGYDLRYWRLDLDSMDWSGMTAVVHEWAPKRAGDVDTFEVEGLGWGTAYGFVLRAVDEDDNWSELSNAAMATPYDQFAMATAFECPFSTGGDHVRRGFYVTQVPPGRLAEVVLNLSSSAAGVYTILMDCRADRYDGTLIGQSRCVIELSGLTDDNRAAHFRFPLPVIAADSVLAFTMRFQPEAQGSVYYATSNCGESCQDICPVIETEGTEPPLDVFRRFGMSVRMHVLPPVR